MVIESNTTGATITMGRYWDFDFGIPGFTATIDSFYFPDWPKGDHFDVYDYASAPNETQANSLAEIVGVCIKFGVGDYHSITINYYDSYGRLLWSGYRASAWWAFEWIGRFGELNLGLEITKPGRYYVIITANGGTAKLHFDVYSQSSTKYIHKQGDDYGSGNSWPASKATFASAQTALSAGNTIMIGEGDYSSETGHSFTKSQTLTPVKTTWGGYPNLDAKDYDDLFAFGNDVTYVEIMNPIEMNGTIDRWAVYINYPGNCQVKLKIYYGGNIGTINHTASTRRFEGDASGNGLETIANGASGWQIFNLNTPVGVEKGDVLAVYCNTVGKIILLLGNEGSNLICNGDAGASVDLGYTYIYYLTDDNAPMLLLRAWNSNTQFSVKLSKTS